MNTRQEFVHDMKNLLGIILGYGGMLLEDMARDDPRRADVQEVTKAADGALELLDRWSASSPEDV